MKQIYNIILLVFLFTTSSVAQTVTWNRYYNFQNHENYGKDVLQTYDGGYLILSNNITPGDSRILLIKTDQFGNIEWQRPVADSLELISQSIQQASDSGFVISGYGNSNMFILKTSKNGNLIWFKSYVNTLGATRSYKIILIENDYILSCGDIVHGNSSNSYLVKTDFDGNLIWNYEYNDSLYSASFDIMSFKDSIYYVTGTTVTNTFSNNTYCFAKKINSYGQLLWTKIFGFRKSGSGVIQANNNIYIGGTFDSLGFDRYIFLSKLDSSGNIFWEKLFEKGGRCNTMSQDQNGNLILAGNLLNTNKPDAGVIKIDTEGNLLQTKILNYTPSLFFSMINSFKKTYDNGFIFVGITDYPGKNENLNIVGIKTDSIFNSPTVNITSNSIINPIEFLINQNYPNPFNPSTTISYELPYYGLVKIKVYDVSGREVKTLVNEFKTAGRYNIIFDGINLASGVYFYRLESNEFIQTKRMVLIK